MTLRHELTPALAAVRGLYGAAACSCALADPDGSSLVFMAADGAGADLIVGVAMPVGRGIAGYVALSGQPLAVSDVSRDERFARDVAESTDYVPTTILAAPIFDPAGDTLGVIEVLDPASVSADLAVLGVLASFLGRLIALHRGADDALLRTVSGLDADERLALSAFLSAFHGRR